MFIFSVAKRPGTSKSHYIIFSVAKIFTLINEFFTETDTYSH